MITFAQYKHFLELAAAHHGGIVLGLNPNNSSVTPVLEAMEAYVQAPELRRFLAIRNALERMPTDKRKKYRRAVRYLEHVLDNDRSDAERIETTRRLERNTFRVTSDLDEYRRAFGADFGARLAGLGSDGTWMDGGAGEARAMRAYLDGGGAARCVAFVYETPTNAGPAIAAARRAHPNFSYHAIGLFEKADLATLGGAQSCDVITDLNGVLYYTETFGVALRRYISMLKIGGRLYFTGSALKFLCGGARETPVLTWLQAITGVKVARCGAGNLSFVLKRQLEKVVVPHLRLVEANRGGHLTNNAVERTYACDHLPN